MRQVLGTAPENIVGVLGGDWLERRRMENIAKTAQRARELLRGRVVQEPEPVSLSLGLPLLRAAADESRDDLQEIWARLLAAAMDPARRSMVSRTLIEIVHQMEPIDALVMEKLSETPTWSPNARDAFAQMFKVSSDLVEMSFGRIARLGCAKWASTDITGQMPLDTSNVFLAGTGRVLMTVVRA